MPKETSVPIQPTLPLPSADYLQYRFDSMEKKFDHLDQKLDKFTSTFLTKEEAAALRQEWVMRLKEVDDRFKTMQWYWRTVVTATFFALCSSIAALLLRLHG